MDKSLLRVYEIFTRYRRPKDFPACECCLSKDEKSRLLTRTLKDIGPDELGGYAADAFLTVGSLPDFKYFVPRILELSVCEEFSWPYPEVVLGKLTLADWELWPTDERTAVLDVLQDKFDKVLSDPTRGGSEIDQWVCALGQCVQDMTVYLDQLFEPGGEEPLSGFIEWNLSALTKGKLSNAFWEAVPTSAKQVQEWLNQSRIRAMLSERYGMRFESE